MRRRIPFARTVLCLGLALAALARAEDLSLLEPPDDRRNAAEKAFKERRLAESIRLYRRIIETHARSVPDRLKLATALRWNAQYAEAEKEYRQILTWQPDNFQARVGLALTLASLKQPKMALESFRENLDRDPDHPDSLLGAGRILYWQGDWESAREMLARGRAKAPGYDEMLQAERQVRWSTRPVAWADWGTSSETEQSSTLRRDEIRIERDAVSTGLRYPWSRAHKSELSRSWEWIDERNLLQHRNNYRVTEESWKAKHTIRLDDDWSESTTVGWGEYDDHGGNLYRLGTVRPTESYRQSVTRDSRPHLTTLSASRDTLLVKEFPTRYLRTLHADTWSLDHAWQPTSRWRADAGVSTTDYEKANRLHEWRLDLLHIWDNSPYIGTSIGWTRRRFAEDVAEYYSYDVQDRWSIRTNIETADWMDWKWKFRHAVTWADTTDRVNARQVLVSDTPTTAFGTVDKTSVTNRISVRAEHFLREQCRIWAEASWSLSSEDYRTSSLRAGLEYQF